MGLHLFGRRERLRATFVGICHIFGGVVGGAALGGLLGELGSVLALHAWRCWILLALGIFALWHSLDKRSVKLGRLCQVNRRWNHRIPTELAYFLWGLQLGCGVVTFIPYSCFIVLLGTQATSGIVTGLLSGALFGGTREAIVLLGLQHRHDGQVGSNWLRSILPSLTPKVRILNTLLILFSVPLLVFIGLH